MLKTINSRLFVFIGLTIIIIFTIFSFIFISHQNNSLISEVYKDANLYSQLILESTKFNMPIQNRECVQRMMRLIGKRSQVKMIRMFDNKGKISFSTNAEEVNTYVNMKIESCSKCHSVNPPLEDLNYEMRSRIFNLKNEKILAFTTPIPNQPSCYTHQCHVHDKNKKILGTIDVGISMTETHNVIDRTQWIFILFTVITITILSLILFFFINKLVLNPVKKMVSVTKIVSEGNLDITVPNKTKCEIGQLASSFNKMILDLKNAHDKINLWNLELEKKVEERSNKLNQAKNKLLQAEKMASMGVLAASVAHEINNPLQGILTYIKLMIKILNKKDVDIHKIQEFNQYLTLMRDEIERCGGMVKNLLVFSKQTKLNIEDANINHIIANTLKIVKSKMKLQNIKITSDLDQELSIIRCDLKQIQQTIIAFLINASEAVEKDGIINICTSNLSKKLIEIRIIDNGKGIDQKQITNIFDPFYTTKKDAKSTGLGLFVAYGIIKEHGGTVEVFSEVSKRTEFVIKLPVKSSEAKKNES